MRRFFAEDLAEGTEEVVLTGEELRHLKVLRLGKGAPVRVFNGRGLEVASVVAELGPRRALLHVIGPADAAPESPVEVTLIQALLKGEKPSFVVRKATELGVKRIIFFSAGRTVPWPDEKRLAARLFRWRKVAVEAAKQSGRAVVPAVEAARALDQAAAMAPGPLGVILCERGASPIKEALGAADKKGGVALLTGPEGGFSDAEVNGARALGFRPAGLGPRVLRAETAAIAALVVVQYELGDLSFGS